MVSFKLFAGTNKGLRENNEDNFTVCPDLTKDEWIVPVDQQQAIPLGKRGCVMVVADGMGGQNAGEVASAIAINTVQEMLSPEHLPADVLEKPDSIKSFLKRVIVEADKRVKLHADEYPETFGLGSTIIIAWLLGQKVYIAWLGDSRAYSFLPEKGIGRLSKDHSYVQQLVDSGAITEEEAMNHPNSNIITRSLGDTSQKAKADVAEYEIENGEIILLCSDGLCGVCEDSMIDDIISAEQADLVQCKDALITAALNEGGSDNITIAMLQVLSDDRPSDSPAVEKSKRISKKQQLLIAACASLIALCTGILLLANRYHKKEQPVWGIVLNIQDKTLEAQKKIPFSVRITGGDTTFTLVYNNKLLNVNYNDSTISLRPQVHLGKDQTEQIVAICDADTSKRHTVNLLIKRNTVNAVQAIMLVPREGSENDMRYTNDTVSTIPGKYGGDSNPTPSSKEGPSIPTSSDTI